MTERRTCRKCGGEFPLTQFPIQPQSIGKGARMQVCTYCRGKALAGEFDQVLKWDDIPLPKEEISIADIKHRLFARAAARGAALAGGDGDAAHLDQSGD